MKACFPSSDHTGARSETSRSVVFADSRCVPSLFSVLYGFWVASVVFNGDALRKMRMQFLSMQKSKRKPSRS